MSETHQHWILKRVKEILGCCADFYFLESAIDVFFSLRNETKDQRKQWELARQLVSIAVGAPTSCGVFASLAPSDFSTANALRTCESCLSGIMWHMCRIHAGKRSSIDTTTAFVRKLANTGVTEKVPIA